MSYESEIQELRKKLDTIDDEIVGLLIKRFSVTSQVGKLKTAHNMEIADHLRETAILNKIKEKIEKQINGDQDPVLTYITQVYVEIMKLSKQQQVNE